MKTARVRSAEDLKRLLRRLQVSDLPLPRDEAKVAKICREIRQKGDPALLACVRRLDGFKAKSTSELRLHPAQIRAAYAKVGRGFLRAVQNVRDNIEAFQGGLRPHSWRRQLRSGVTLGQSVRPIRRVGLYVPGGQAPLASTVLMTAVPARVAGVAEIALCTPNRGSGVDPRILVAADVAGVTEIYQMGGAHAIAALAYGTQSIARVDKIAGPGSKWVNLAKKRVYGDVGIDSLAGPSEAMILADDSANPVFVAADLLSQAEHSGHETAVLVTNSERLAAAVGREIEAQIKTLTRKAAAEKSLKGGGWIISVKNIEMALEIANARGPEHLQIMLRGAEAYLPKIKAAGAIFLGANSPVALGDFVAGPSHVLPTGATARFSSGLSAEDFVTKSSIISYSRPALEAAAADAEEFALAEGLQAHGRSLSLRLGKSGGRR
jgi:histidinol dehydrogenase